MSKYLIVIMLVMGAIFGWYYKSSQAEIKSLYARLAVYEVREETQKETIATLIAQTEKATQAYSVIVERNSALEAEKDRYLDIFRRHNLTRLAAAKPGLIQTKINKGTKDVFDSIEETSKWTVDSPD